MFVSNKIERHLQLYTSLIAEALTVIDQEKTQGNELYKLMCNLAPFEGHFNTLRQQIADSDKHSSLVLTMKALETGAEWEHIDNELKGDFVPAAMLASLIAFAERFAVVFKDAAQSPGQSQSKAVTAAVGNSLKVLCELVDPVIETMKLKFQALAENLRALVQGAEDTSLFVQTLPELDTVIKGAEVGVLKIMQPGLQKYFEIVASAASSCGADLPPCHTAGCKLVESAKAAVQMISRSNELSDFLESGSLGLSDARLPQATELIGEFFKHLKMFEGIAWEADISEIMKDAANRWKKCGSALAQELVSPLEADLFRKVFSHKFMQDTLRV